MNNGIDIDTILSMIDIDVNISSRNNICTECNLSMINIDIYQHIEDHYKNTYPNVFNEPNLRIIYLRNINRSFLCTVCNMDFNSEIELNTHFSDEHDDYHAYNTLDNTPYTKQFIGFDKLIELKLLEYVKENNNDFMKYQKENSYCTICTNKWNSYHTYHSNNTECDKNITFPLLLTCCKKYICQKCIRDHVLAKRNNFVCPWCNIKYKITTDNYVDEEVDDEEVDIDLTEEEILMIINSYEN